VSKAIEIKSRKYHVLPNHELIALGASNIVGSFFQSYPVTGGFSRSAVNQQVGAITPMSSLVSALLVGLTLLFLTPLFYYLPHAILSSVILVAVSSLVDWRYAGYLWKSNKIEFAVLLFTFIITLNVSMVVGILSGILLSILMLLYKSAYPHIARLGKMKSHHEYRNIRRFKDLETWENLMILRVDASLTFINVQYFIDYVNTTLEKEKAINSIILDAGPVSMIDASAAHSISEMLDDLTERHIHFYWCDLIGPVRDSLHKTGLINKIGQENVFLDINEAVRFVIDHKKDRYHDFALQANP
jgi:SulP family sulfate permease